MHTRRVDTPSITDLYITESSSAPVSNTNSSGASGSPVTALPPVPQGVVGGVLIVTPNNIMFDPHKSDPLVIEHGCEEYGLICPMEEVVSVALYDDVSRMKLKDAPPS